VDERWKVDLAEAEVQGLAFGDGGVVIVATADGQSIGFDLLTGTPLVPLPDGWVRSANPEVSSSEIEVEVWEGGVGAFDATSGTERWWCELDDDYLVSLARDVDHVAVNGRRGLHVVDAAHGQLLGVVGAHRGVGIDVEFVRCEPGPVICAGGWVVAVLADGSLVGVEVVAAGSENNDISQNARK
jgi:outer membrane protein assembly factor BamB